jgi:imidazolonepropionase-like amidohydrolase
VKRACWLVSVVLVLVAGAAVPGSARAGTVVLRHVSIFDPVAGAIEAPQDILIEGSRISEVGKVRQPVAGAIEIECTGKYAIAGLFDCHTHLAHLSKESDDSLRAVLEAFAASGITQVRDVGGPVDVLGRMKRRVAGGEIAGPEIFYAGPMLEASPLTYEGINVDLPGFTVAIDTQADVDSILPDLARKGASIVKTFNKFDRDVYRHLVEVAGRCSLKVVHDPGQPLFNSIPIDVAIDLGVTSIEHAKAPWPVVLKDDLKREHDSLLVSGAGEGALMTFMMKLAEMDTASVSLERLRQLGEKMKARGVYLCPTLEVFTSVEEFAMEQVKEQMKVDEVPEMVRGMIRKQIAVMETLSRLFVRELAAEGVKMLVGQDGFEPGGTFAEMRRLKECGVSEVEIIRGATIYPARWLGVDDRLGSIAPGKQASLLVVEENPLEDIARLASPFVVIREGQVISH